MPTKAEIKKGNGIEDLFRGFAAGKPEETRKIAVDESLFGSLIEQYAGFLDLEIPVEEEEAAEEDRVFKLTHDVKQILDPDAIYLFLQTITGYENHENYGFYTGYFISKLMQNSYGAGYNDFTLNTISPINVAGIGSFLKGRKEDPIRLTVDSDVGYGCGMNSKYLVACVKGSAGMDLGASADRCVFDVRGNTGDYCGYGAVKSVFNILGDVGLQCGKEAEESEFNIKGNVEGSIGHEAKNSILRLRGSIGASCGWYAENCIFDIESGPDQEWAWFRDSNTCTLKTSNYDTLQKLLKRVTMRNKIIYVHKDGREETFKEFGEESELR